MTAAWKWMLGCGAAAVGAYFLLPGAGAKDIGYSVIGLAAVAAVLTVGVRSSRRTDGRSWYAVAAGNLCFVAGDGVYDVYQFMLHRAAPTPSVADLFYLAGYPFLIVGVVGLTRQEGHGRASRESYADAAIVTLGALAVSWHFLMASYANDVTMGEFAKLVTLAYPVMDLGVLFIVVRGLFSRSQSPVLGLLVIAMLSMVLADFAYDLLNLHGAYETGNPVDAGWLINYVLVATAALYSTSTTPNLPPPPRLEADSGRRLPVVALAGFVSPAILVTAALLGSPNDVVALGTISIVLFGLLVLRMRWMFSRILRQSRSLEHALEVRGSLEAELRHRAFHDALTGLPNRALLQDRAERALAASSRGGTAVSVAFCDLDGFKSINDTLGHLAGDTILIAVGERLAGVVRPGDTVARLGGDEFAVLMEDVRDPALASSIAERIVSALRDPVTFERHRVAFSVSVGVATGGADVSAERLLSNADAAMYEAKAAGKDRVAVFDHSMHARISERLLLSEAFDGALDRGEFFLQYQPQYSLTTGGLLGFEALIRWHHPTLGLVEPDRFIHLAEDSGHIIPIGRWVIERACQQAADWTRIAGPLHMAVNLSALQLKNSQLIDDVGLAVALGGLSPGQLVLEITESVLIADSEHSLRVLGGLKATGVRLAIDDFGTGYSSLSYLQRMPIDELKIDKSFVDALATLDTEGTAFVSTIVNLGHTLGLHVIAEGVEDDRQRRTLRELGCDAAQGYLWAPALDIDAATALVDAARTTIDS